MTNLSRFCTCTNLECPLHPTRHDKGCAPCISKNLKLGEIPNCMFLKVKDTDDRKGDSYRDFAEVVLRNMQ